MFVADTSTYRWLSHDILGYPLLHMEYPDYLSLARVQSTNRILSGSVRLNLDLLKPWRMLAALAACDDSASPAVKHMSQPHPMQVWLK